VSVDGEVVADLAVGDTEPGAPLTTEHVMLWYSAGKPLTTVAVLQLIEQGALGLDDRVGRYLTGWSGDKESCTVRHVLTHMGGFAGCELFDEDLSYAESVARIAAWPAEYEPGTRAGYHPTSGWKVLGELVRVVDGRPVDQYVRERVLAPAGMTDTWLGIPPEEQDRLGERLAPVHWTGHVVARQEVDGTLRMSEYHVEKVHNERWHRAKVDPGGGARGPAHDLGRFYEALARGQLFQRPDTLTLMAASHRVGVGDRTLLGLKLPWGLGVQVAGGFSGRVGYRTFGHNGMASSRGFHDPVEGLTVVVVCNGLAGILEHERRMSSVTEAVYQAVCPRPRGPRVGFQAALPPMAPPS
jgi:CubicO group peptidase (beta-lactamase class C family)